jgi:hypothetical protein
MFCLDKLDEKFLKSSIEQKELSVLFWTLEYVIFIIYTSKDGRNNLDI